MYPDERMKGKSTRYWEEFCPRRTRMSTKSDQLSDATRPSFLELVRQRVVFLDGAMVTSIHTYNLDVEREYLGHENCSEILIETRPEVIREIHESLLAIVGDEVATDAV